MPDSNHTNALVNTFAIRSFRDTGDLDYIAARLSNRSNLVPPFLWQSLQSVEKYLKCILVLNRVRAPRSHDLSELLNAVDGGCPFTMRLSDTTRQFIEYLDTHGRFRYFETPYYTIGDELTRLDRTVWEVRRYAQVLNTSVRPTRSGRRISLLEPLLANLERAEQEPPQDFTIHGGLLEKFIRKRDHPSRAGLIWNNLFYGSGRRKTIRKRTWSVSANSPLAMDPGILDEVLKYVYLPKDVVRAYREIQ